MKRNFLIVPWLIFLVSPRTIAQDLFLDRPYSQRVPDSRPLLWTLHRQTTGGNLEAHYPRRDSLWRKDLPENTLYTHRGTRDFLAVSALLGYNYLGSRTLGDTIHALEGGLFLRGYRDSVEFWLDARIYNEDHTNAEPRSWDREFLEVQDQSINGELTYTSYARYRGHLAVHLGWSRLDLGRDAAHWGPAYWNSLVLNQNAIPFPQASLESQVGPLTVKTLYGDLNIDAHSMSNANRRARNLYAHRYEMRLGEQWLLGISELTIVDSIAEPALLIPIVPLFMHKGQMPEDYNNGLLAADLTWRIPGLLRIYGEFLLDDLESPISLIKNDNIEAKWGATWGVHLIRNLGVWQGGLIAEYARVEPYVYTHFIAQTAQVAHQNQPLGAPLGPNSQSIDALLYGRYREKLTLSLSSQWHWKGTDYGSALNDTTPRWTHHSTPKTFLNGAAMRWTVIPRVAYEGQWIHTDAELRLGDERGFACRLGVLW